jgi:hemoglobin
MRIPELCTEAEIHTLVHTFYASIRHDRVLGPIFDAHVRNWDVHLAKMVDFWSSVLLGTARYRGTPMPAHCALPQLRPELFQRWLALFRDTTQAVGNAPMQAQADELAQRIARSLWYGYQLFNVPGTMPEELDQESG